jgi:hypothetical protein
MRPRLRTPTIILTVALLGWVPTTALAHCDALDGPVAKDARVALESQDVTPVVKWIATEKEGEIRDAFRRAVTVRALGGEARALADRFFLETLVRVHREGEGEPYTGLKPAGAAIDPGISAADEALEVGSVDPLAKMLSAKVDEGLRARYARAAEARAHAAESAERGREYVAAYAAFIHYAERIHADAGGVPAHAGHPAAPEAAGPSSDRH